MSRAKEVIQGTNGCAGAVRKAAQKACASMTRQHKLNRDEYKFADGSAVVVCGHKVYLNELPLTMERMDSLRR